MALELRETIGYFKEGDFITYPVPQGRIFTLTTEQSGTKEEQIFTNVGLTDICFQYMGIQECEGIKLIGPAMQKVKLEGSIGAINGMDAIDTMHDKLFGQAGYGIMARNVKLEDLNKISKKKILQNITYWTSSRTVCISNHDTTISVFYVSGSNVDFLNLYSSNDIWQSAIHAVRPVIYIPLKNPLINVKVDKGSDGSKKKPYKIVLK